MDCGPRLSVMSRVTSGDELEKALLYAQATWRSHVASTEDRPKRSRRNCFYGGSIPTNTIRSR